MRDRSYSPSRPYLRILAASAIFALVGVGACTATTGDVGTNTSKLTPGVDPCPSEEATLHANVLTERTDYERTSANVRPGFNPSLFAPASHFGLLARIPVNAFIWSQPLYASGVTMTSDNQAHEVLVVATGANTVYAFDANTYATLWGGKPITLAGAPVGGSGETSVISTPVIDTNKQYLYVSYMTGDSLTNEYWIAQIQLSSGTIVNRHHVTASHFNASTGTGGIGNNGQCSANTELCADPNATVQRAGLLLANGILYVAFAGSHEGVWDPTKGFAGANGEYRYRGQILGYNATNLAFAGSFTTVTPGVAGSRMGGGIWQGSVGPAYDCETGDVYVATGNAISDLSISSTSTASDLAPGGGSYANTVLQLKPTEVTNSGVVSVGLNVGASFTPYSSYWLSVADVDLGASGPMLFPGTNQLVQAGKEGILYLLDRDKMTSGPSPMTAAEYNAYPTTDGLCVNSAGTAVPQAPDTLASNAAGATGPIFQANNPARDGLTAANEFQLATNFDIPQPVMTCWALYPHVHGTPSSASFTSGQYMYVWPEKDYLKAYQATSLSPLAFNPVPAKSSSTAPSPSGMPGGLLSVAVDPEGTANLGPEEGVGGVIMASVPVQSVGFATPHGSLHAYSAIPNGNTLVELWNDEGESYAPNNGYYYARYSPPTIGANNRVYLATQSVAVQPDNAILVYGAGANTGTQLSAPAAPVTAFHQDAANKQITVATVGIDGAVHVFWEMNNGPWSPQQEAAVTPTGLAVPWTGLVSVPELDGKTFDTFFIDNNDAIEWLSVVDGQAWKLQGPISAGVGTFPAQSLTATTIRGFVEVFAVSNEGAAWVFSKQGAATSFTATQITYPSVYLSTAANSFTSTTSFAPLSIQTNERGLLSVGASGQLYLSTSWLNMSTGQWGEWSNVTAVATSPAISFPPNAQWGFSGQYAAAVDTTGTLDAVYYAASLQATPLSKAGGAVGGGRVVLATINDAATPSVFHVGAEGAIDVYSLTSQGWPYWTPPYAAHTQSFGFALPGAPIAVALQDSTLNAQVLDIVVPGVTDLFASYLGGNAPYWAQPFPVFH